MLSRLFVWLRRLLSCPYASIGITAMALVLTSPALGVGLIADDLIHQIMLRGSVGLDGLSRNPLDLFRFASGDPDSARGLMNEGVFPWWSDPSTVLAFFRPIASCTHWLDYRLWPTRSWIMHLHSLVWFALLLAVIAAIYRRFESSRFVGGLALLLFAFDDAHAPVVAWLANRNMMIALTLALPALVVHDRWRRGRHRASAWLAPLALGLGLLAGEAAIVVVAYLVAYALILDRGSRRSRIGSLAGHGAVVFIWRVAYNWMGYGAHGSDVYLDPGRQPLQFAAAALTRFPVLLLGEFALPWADSWEVFPLVAPGLRMVVMVMAITVILALAWLLRSHWRNNRVVRFWAVGSLLATLPICATFPHDRLLMGPSIGGMALLAHLFASVRSRKDARVRACMERGTIGGLVVLHVLLAPVLLPCRIYSLLGVNEMFRRANESISSSLSSTPESVVLVNPPIDPLASYFVIYREAAQRRRPRHLLWLANGVTELRITRVDARTLCVEPRDGLFSNSTQLMLRSLRRPIQLGQQTVLDDASFEVTAVTNDNRPRRILVHFKRELEAPEFVWLQWGIDRYVPFRPPAPGATIVLPAVDMRTVLFG
jgi:hypothetical protein